LQAPVAKPAQIDIHHRQTPNRRGSSESEFVTLLNQDV
jgi:hypothetical protein